jgi:hypothetical protein
MIGVRVYDRYGGGNCDEEGMIGIKDVERGKM